MEILNAILYKFFKIANFNVPPKHDDQQILLYITFCRNVPIHIPWAWMALLAQLVVFGQRHEAAQALSYSDASENNNEQSEWKKLKRDGNTFATDKNNIGFF